MSLLPLKLTILQGPNEGETREFKPGTTARIGRVVKGNNLTIKDSGISSKHLVIGSETGKWVIQDLDSSNGTFLNSTAIDAKTAFDLHHGDVVKIGELTSILVEFVEPAPPPPPQNVVAAEGKNPRRRGRKPKGSKEEESVQNDAVEEQRKAAENCDVGGEGVVRRSTRRRGKATESEGVVELGDKGTKVSPRRTRSKKNERSVAFELPENSELGVGGRRTRAGTRRTRKNGEIEIDKGNSEEHVPVVNVEVKKEIEEVWKVGVSEAGNIGEENNNVSNLGEPGQVDPVFGASGSSGKGSCAKVFNLGGNESEGMTDGIRAEKGNAEGVKMDSSVGANNWSEGKRFDLDKNTLGEWFDYIEVSLIKEIDDVAEETLKGMREKVDRVKEYVKQQLAERKR